ncbi:MAG: phosphoenolpyruvate synthase [Deltaproteobacteria bacterium]|nr:phosphoenolpyruvate synthase [Deltaproteobacteria bacterium]
MEAEAMDVKDGAVVLALSAVGRGDLGRVGGKGASLGQRLRDGFPLPDGFVVTAEAYRRFVAEAGLQDALEAQLSADDVSRAEPQACERASAALRAAFLRAAIPPALADALREAWAGLGGGPVAVRSSATAEDLPDASFAGQQETILGVRGEAALLAAVRACWSSLWTSRAIAYRVRQGFDHGEVSLAVVVQRMVEPEAAGVLFTTDPVTGRDEMVLNAAYGLGEVVVSGWVTPDLWRLARADGKVLEHRLGSKERRVVSDPAGGTRAEEVPEALRAAPCLPPEALGALHALGLKVEAAEGVAQDIEFAWAEGRVVLLQSRPITTRPAPPRSLSARHRKVVDDILEHYPSAPMPLDEEPLHRGYDQLLAVGDDLGLAMPAASALLPMDENGVYRVAPADPRPSLGLVQAPFALVRAWRRDPSAWGARAGELGVDLSALRAVEPSSLDDAALWEHAQRALDAGYRVARVRFAEVIVPGALWGQWLTALARLADEKVDPFEWLGGLRYRTVDIEHGLQALADRCLGSPALRALYEGPAEVTDARVAAAPDGEAYLQAVEAFLSAHGARTGMAYLPFSTRSWREDRAGLHRAVGAMVRAGETGAAARRTAAGLARFEAREEAVRRGLPRVLRRTFARTLRAWRDAHVAREASLYAIEEAYGVARGAMAEVGRRLAARGALAAPGHVAFARMGEAREALLGDLAPAELRRRVGRRRSLREVASQAWRAQRPVPERAQGAPLTGTAGSPGVASGPARVILTVEDSSRLQPGDVLVCPYTDPTWTPLFSLASAVVSDTGGPLSHAAIVAREYGIPAVLGTEVGTRALKDGERVVVDGGAGEVRRTADTNGG